MVLGQQRVNSRSNHMHAHTHTHTHTHTNSADGCECEIDREFGRSNEAMTLGEEDITGIGEWNKANTQRWWHYTKRQGPMRGYRHKGRRKESDRRNMG